MRSFKRTLLEAVKKIKEDGKVEHEIYDDEAVVDILFPYISKRFMQTPATKNNYNKIDKNNIPSKNNNKNNYNNNKNTTLLVTTTSTATKITPLLITITTTEQYKQQKQQHKQQQQNNTNNNNISVPSQRRSGNCNPAAAVRQSLPWLSTSVRGFHSFLLHFFLLLFISNFEH